MAYNNIMKADGTAIPPVVDGQIDSRYYGSGVGIRLVGRNSMNYGVATAQNFLQITENFCSPTPPPPATALQGQLWFDKTNRSLKVNTSATEGTTTWESIPTIAPSGAVTGYDGQIRVVGSTVSVWANGGWRQIYPAVYS